MLVLGCTSDPEAVSPVPDAEAPSAAPSIAVEDVNERQPKATDEPPPQGTTEFVGGPVFWTEEGLEVLGSASQLIGPNGVEDAILLPENGPCGGQLLANKTRAVLALPSELTLIPPSKAPSNSATVVETAQWRMNEVLSEAGSQLESPPSQQPSTVTLGSVSKTRRTGAPPVYIVTGVRNCTAAVAILDRDLRTVLDQELYTGICDPMAVLPPSNLNHQQGREVVLYNPKFVAVLSLIETPGSIEIEPLRHWTCPATDSPK